MSGFTALVSISANAEIETLKVLGKGVVDSKSENVLQIACVDENLHDRGEVPCLKLQAIQTDPGGSSALLGHPLWLGTRSSPDSELAPGEYADILRTVIGIRSEVLQVHDSDLNSHLRALIADAFVSREQNYWQLKQKKIEPRTYQALVSIFGGSAIIKSSRPRISGIQITGAPSVFILADYWTSSSMQKSVMRKLLKRGVLNYADLPGTPTASLIVEALALLELQDVFEVVPSDPAGPLTIHAEMSIFWKGNIPTPYGSRYRWRTNEFNWQKEPQLKVAENGPFQNFIQSLKKQVEYMTR